MWKEIDDQLKVAFPDFMNDHEQSVKVAFPDFMKDHEQSIPKETLALTAGNFDQSLLMNLNELEAESRTYEMFTITSQQVLSLFDATLESKEKNVKKIVDELVATKEKLKEFQDIAVNLKEILKNITELEENKKEMDALLKEKATDEERKDKQLQAFRDIAEKMIVDNVYTDILNESKTDEHNEKVK